MIQAAKILKLDSSTVARIRHLLPDIVREFPDDIARKIEQILNDAIRSEEISHDDAYTLLALSGYRVSSEEADEEDWEDDEETHHETNSPTTPNHNRAYQLLCQEISRQIFLQSAVLDKNKGSEIGLSNILNIERGDSYGCIKR